jgi:hypothetical protein
LSKKLFAAAPEHMHNPADHAPIIRSLDTTHIPNPRPLLVRQPEQIPAHQFFPNTNQSYCSNRKINEFWP